MPPHNNAPIEPDPNRVRTRAGNAQAHPGDALKAQRPTRDPELIRKEKADKEAKKAAKQKQLEETRAKEESATLFVKEYRARKEIEESADETTIPRQRPKRKFLILFFI
jgi:hypothetical protein